jgi:hypothetical protein
VAADFPAGWTRDLGDGRLLVVERDPVGYRASIAGFRGVGSTQEIALDGLLACMRDYVDASADLERSLAPGGELDGKLQQIRALVDQRCAEETATCPHCRAKEPSVWDDVLFHYAHPHPTDGDKLKLCHDPWRDRCRRCSASVGACACATEAAIR